MKLPRFLLPVVIFLAVLFLSYPVIPKEFVEVFIVNDPVPVAGSRNPSLPVQITGKVTNPVLNDPSGTVPVIGSNNPDLPAVQVAGTVNVAKAPSDIVSLVPSFGTNPTTCNYGRDLREALPDGHLGPDKAFTPPYNTVLIVTSLQWYSCGFVTDTYALLYLMRQAAGPGSTMNVALKADAIADSFGCAGGSLTLPKGLVLKSGSYLCARDSGISDRPQLHVQGFLADDM